jgi:hypothetical protein
MKTTQPGMAKCQTIVRKEFRDLPGLHLTKPQIQRLCGLEPAACDALLAELVEQHFLKRMQRGVYGRADMN